MLLILMYMPQDYALLLAGAGGIRTATTDFDSCASRHRREARNLSRAWTLEGIAEGVPRGDKRLPMIMAAAEEHESAGLAAVTGKHYEGGHWLGSFAVYPVTKRGISG
jgi:hypothetical protein